jgi:type III secretion protein L
MTLFSLIDQTKVHLAPGQKILKSDEYQKLINADELVQKTLSDTDEHKKQSVYELEQAKELAEQEGFQAGLETWANELATIENEIIRSREEFEKAVLSTAILAAQKFVGRELKLDSETMVDIVKNSLKAVSQHKRISIYCHVKDFEALDKARPQLKQLFEELEILGVYPKDGIEEGGYLIETERGIINHSDVNKVWQTLQQALETALKNFQKKESQEEKIVSTGSLQDQET